MLLRITEFCDKMGAVGSYDTNTMPLWPYQMGVVGSYDTNTMPLWPYQMGVVGSYDTNTMPLWPYQMGVAGRSSSTHGPCMCLFPTTSTPQAAGTYLYIIYLLIFEYFFFTGWHHIFCLMVSVIRWVTPYTYREKYCKCCSNWWNCTK